MAVAAESADQFWQEFNETVALLKSELGALSPESADIAGVLKDVKTRIAQLQSYATISTIVLPAYDVRRSQEILQEVSKEMIAIETKLKPKKKFAFSSKTKKQASTAAEASFAHTASDKSGSCNSNNIASITSSSGVSADQTTATNTESHSANNFPPFVPPHSAETASVATKQSAPSDRAGGFDCDSSSNKAKQDTITAMALLGAYTISDKHGATVLLSDSDLQPASSSAASSATGNHGGGAQMLPQIYIVGNENCDIKIPTLLGSVRIESCRNCRVLLGPCATSVYLESLESCTVQASCHQLRIHTCTHCSFYVRVQSHPIVEDCVEVGFAPYNFSYFGIARHFKSAELEHAACWDNVVDFRWHKSTHSPNWHVIPVADRLPTQFPTIEEAAAAATGATAEVEGVEVVDKDDEM